jgi:calcium-dependent protein kinase
MEHLKAKRNYQERDAADIARALVTTIAYCHQNSVVHRDLKLENLLMSDATQNAVLKVTDFGLSTFLVSDTEVLRDHVGSAWYIAPEVLRGAYSKQVGPSAPVLRLCCAQQVVQGVADSAPALLAAACCC